MDKYKDFEEAFNPTKISSLKELNETVFGFSESIKLLESHFTSLGFPQKAFIPYIRSMVVGNLLKVCICENLIIPQLDKRKIYNADNGKFNFLITTKEKQKFFTKHIDYKGNQISLNYLILEYEILPRQKIKETTMEVMSGSSENISFVIFQSFLKEYGIEIQNEFDIIQNSSRIIPIWFDSSIRKAA